MKKIILILLIVLGFYLSGCCNCTTEKNLIKGYITVIGNEPFTQLAINDGKKIFAIKCEKELYNKLKNSQGAFFVLEFDDAFQKDNINFLNVVNAIPLNKN